MKLKISPQFWQNLFYKKLFWLCLICLIASKAFANNSSPPGIIESFERLLTAQKDLFDKEKNTSVNTPPGTINLKNYIEIKFQPAFIQSINLNSDDGFLLFAKKDECRFLSVVETSLLKSSEGEIDRIHLVVIDKEKVEKKISMNKDDFFEQIYKIKCLNYVDFSTIFSELNFKKTVEGIKFTIPKNKDECRLIHSEWLENKFTPYLCRIQQTVKKPSNKTQADFYKEKIPLVTRTYLDNLCQNLNNQERFCSKYLKNDIWSKVLNSEVPTWKMSYKCQQMYNKKDALTDIEIKNCAAKLATTPLFCETNGSADYPSYFPLQNCETISNSLVKAKLKTNYHDCPGNIDNEAITNIHRIVNHFNPRDIATSPDTCAGEANYSLARLNFDIKFESGWPLKVCYFDNISSKEKCDTYIPGSRAEEPLSEDQVVAKILYAQKGAPSRTKCRIVSSKIYNPIRSDFKFGCFIVNSSDSCTTLSCEKKVIWDNKVQTDIKFVGLPIFDYFPTTYKNERYSFTKMLNEVRGTQDRMIRNLTDMKFFLDSVPTSIIHGVGCAEDLIPDLYQRSTINQCRPLPFIVDGYSMKGEETWLVTRLSIDDLHTPRMVSWPSIFNAVSAYQEIHPMNTWTFYGIKK